MFAYKKLGYRYLEPQANGELENWWQSRDIVQKRDRRKFDTLVILLSWMIWKQWNARVFGNTRDQCNVAQLTERIKAEFIL
jgi:hypothetical protein